MREKEDIHSYELKLKEIAKLFWLQSPWGFCPRVKKLLEKFLKDQNTL